MNTSGSPEKPPQSPEQVPGVPVDPPGVREAVERAEALRVEAGRLRRLLHHWRTRAEQAEADAALLRSEAKDAHDALDRAEAEAERLRDGLREIAADHERQTATWQHNDFPTELAREWHNGYVTACASHAIKAKKFYDPEGAAEDDRIWRIGCDGTDQEWYAATGHCGHCGNVGTNCMCTADDPCGCLDAHGPRREPWVSPEARAEAAEARYAALRDAVEAEASAAEELADMSFEDVAIGLRLGARSLRSALASVEPADAAPETPAPTEERA